MSSAVTERGDLEACVAHALALSRIAQAALHESIVPAMPPARRTFAVHLARRLARRDIFDEQIARDLETLRETVQTMVDAGTRVDWQADEHHVRGGWDVVVRDDGINALAGAAGSLGQLSAAIRRALDAGAAIRITNDLTGQ